MVKKIVSQDSNMSKIFLMSIMSVFLYILALTMPITAFLLPTYKIRNMLTMKKWEWVTVNITVPLAILATVYVLDFMFNIRFTYTKTLGGYLLAFFPIELLYLLFIKIKKVVPVFDRIIITGVITSLLVFAYLQTASAEVTFIKKGLEEFYLKQYNIDSQTLAIIFKTMKENALYIIYSYLGAVVYLTYYSLRRSEYSKWKISYQWLLFYIVPFFLIKFTSIENIYLTNIMGMAKVSFIAYGVKILYNLINKKLKIDTVCQLIAVMIGVSFPNITFILGGLHCFEFMKVKVIKINNGGK